MKINKNSTLNDRMIWLIRVILIVSAIGCAINGKQDVAGTLTIGIVLSFILLETDDQDVE